MHKNTKCALTLFSLAAITLITPLWTPCVFM